MLTVAFAITGIPLFLTMAIPKDQFWVIIVLAYVGRRERRENMFLLLCF